MTPRLICLIGAESTGKTMLAQALARELARPWVPEYLREFCDAHRRTPRQDEQTLILETQVTRETKAFEDAQQRGCEFVLCDTAPLLTAIYSEYVFNDRSLYARAIELHRRYVLTLLLNPDLPWIADGLQRDGEHVRAPITMLIRDQLQANAFAWQSISGNGHERVLAALHAIDAIPATAL
jgi:nicotinamide riboside kinase